MPDLVWADVSEWQGTIDWAAYGAAYDVVCVRALYGSAYVDRCWEANRDGARAHCRSVGWYQYLTAGEDATTQAIAFAHLVGTPRPGEWLMLDIEEGAGDQTARAEAWLLALADLHTAEFTYSYLGMFRSQLTGVTGHRVVAAYGAGEPMAPHDAWQFTDARQFAGIAQPCDANVFHGSLTDFLALIGPGPTADPGGLDMDNATFNKNVHDVLVADGVPQNAQNAAETVDKVATAVIILTDLVNKLTAKVDDLTTKVEALQGAKP